MDSSTHTVMQPSFLSPARPAMPQQQAAFNTPLSSQYNPQTTLATMSSPQSSSLSSPQSLPPDLSALRSAAQLLDRELSSDERRGGDGLESLETRDQGHYRYQPNQLVLTRQLTLPTSITAEYDNVECQSFAGLLPAIHRAYVTIDNRLYLWNIDDPADVYCYSDLQQLIVSVTLLTPPPAIFAPTIPYLLVLTTPVTIHTLAVTFQQPNSPSTPLSLYPTAFTLPSDNTTLTTTATTRTGRLFAGGTDGSLHEIVYAARDGWVHRKMRKMRVMGGPLTGIVGVVSGLIWGSTVDPIEQLVIDDSRSPPYLFARSAANTISCYAVVPGMTPRLLFTHGTVYEQAKDLLVNMHPNSVDDWTDRAAFHLCSIHPIRREESERMVLVAVTTHGHRLYLGWSDSWGGQMQQLRVRLVRLSPPGIDEPEVRGSGRGAGAYEPAWRKGKSAEQVHAAYVRDGVTVLADGIPDAGDHLVSLQRDYTPNTNKVIESVSSTTLPTKQADIAEANQLNSTSATSSLASATFARGTDQPLVGLTEYATQHLVGPRTFYSLSAVGLSVWVRRRALDELCDMLDRRRRSLDDEELTRFFHQYGWKEAGAMLLALACSPPTVLSLGDGRVVEERKEEQVLVMSPSKYEHRAVLDEHVIKQAKLTFFRFAANSSNSAASAPLLPSAPAPPPSSSYALTPYIPPISLTPSMSSLLLFITRILRPIWDWPIVAATMTVPATLVLRLSGVQLSEQSGWLQRLSIFMDEHRRVLRHADREDTSGVLEQLQLLVSISRELVSFLHLLAVNADVPTLLASLPSTDQALLLQSKFYDLITSPPAYAILKQLMLTSSSSPATASPATAASWAQLLYEQAPSFFGHSDLLYYRAATTLRSLPALYDSRDVAATKAEVLQLYRLAARAHSFSVADVSVGLREAGMVEELVELALYRAELVARGEVTPVPLTDTSMSVTGGEASEDDWATRQRNACYQLAIDTLNTILFPSQPIADSALADRLLSFCLSSADPLFLSSLYTYLIQHDMKQLLFASPSAQLLQFLSSSDHYSLLLLQLFLLHGQHRDASLLLSHLASSHTDEHSLHDRVGFLSRALACARQCMDDGATVCGSHEADVEYCEALKERLEVAKLQSKLLARLTGNTPATGELTDEMRDSVRRLDSELLDVEALYLLAQSYGLWDVCLAIFYFSNERGREDVICALWRNVLRGEIVRGRESGVAWQSCVEEKVREMAALYGEVPFMFPLDFVVRECEYNELKYGKGAAGEGGVAAMMARCGVDRRRLMAVYERLVGEGSGMEEGVELQVVSNVVWLLERDQEEGLMSRERRRADVTAFGLVTRCMEAVRGLGDSPAAQVVLERLERLHQRVNQRALTG